MEHYDCEINEVSNVKHYEFNKISTCKFKPLGFEVEKTKEHLLSRAKTIKINAFAVEATIKEEVHWCSQLNDYIRANRTSYYYSDATQSKVLDADEVRNELARIKVLRNTPYQPRDYNISFNFMNSPSLQQRIDHEQGGIEFPMYTPLTLPYGRLPYSYSDESWLPSAGYNPQSNCKEGRRLQVESIYSIGH